MSSVRTKSVFMMAFFAMALVAMATAESDDVYLVCKLSPTEGYNTTGSVLFRFIGGENGSLVALDYLYNITDIPDSGESEASVVIVEFGAFATDVPKDTYNPGGNAPGCPENGVTEPIERRSGDLGFFPVEDGVAIGESYIEGDATKASGEHGIIGRGCVVMNHRPSPCDESAGSEMLNIVAYGTIGIAQASAPLKDAPVVEDGEIFYAHLTGTEHCEDCSGDVYVTGTSSETTIVGAFKGLSGPKHGFHVHQFGDIRSTTGVSAGGHLNKNGGTHGLPGVNDDRHMGDLGQIQTFDAGDVGYYSMKFNSSIDSVGVPMKDILGTTFVVHAGVDHGRGEGCDQAGNAGSRLMYGVIGRAPASYSSLLDDTVPLEITIDNDFEATDCVTEPPPTSSPPAGSPSSSSSDTPGSPASQLTVSIAMIVASMVSLVALLL